jgi:dTDP-4-dehydrorhamnose reductase
MKTMILGNGWIGNKLKDRLQGYMVNSEVHLLADIEYQIEMFKPDVLINCIGHTGGPNVDFCEVDKVRTMESNSFIPIMAAEACIRHGIKLVHLSSGCIYDGERFDESDEPNFFDLFYSRSKIYSESAIIPMAEKFGFLILRLRIPLDYIPHPRNILTKLIEYKKVIDEPNSVTYLPDFLCAVEALLREDAWGVFNVVNDGILRYPDLMEAYKVYRPEFKYEVTTLEELGIKRTNVILDEGKLSKYWEARNINWVLEECVRDYVEVENDKLSL